MALIRQGRGPDARRGGSPLPLIRRRRVWVVGVLAGLGVAVGAWLLLRDSPLVSVDAVTVVGVRGPDAPQIREALTRTAEGMTTLDVDVAALRSAVARFQTVRSVTVSTDFPHGLTIHVTEALPVAAIQLGGHRVAVASDGMLLEAHVAAGSLPLLAQPHLLGNSYVDNPQALALLSAAPRQVLSRLQDVSNDADHGLTAQLRSGPALYFGDTGALSEKWTAVIDVLADPGSAGAAYIDVTDPSRPAAGAGGSATALTGTGGGQAAGAGDQAAGTTDQAAGSTAQTGGSTAQTGGSTAQTDGSTAQTAGSTSEAGGTAAQTGGAASESGGTAAQSGG